MSPTVEVVVADARWRALAGVARCCRGAARAALAAAERDATPAELAIVLTDDSEVRALNRRFRAVDKPTNVLAFPASDGPAPPAGAPRPLGDVTLAYETVAAEARDQGKPIADHLSHLVVHGVLHLLGYDHAADADAEHMESLEVAVLAGLGIEDPYRARP
ncbi:MAG: rRNA maturation RNase YbeY [Alphaproteobacteria bacterium]